MRQNLTCGLAIIALLALVGFTQSLRADILFDGGPLITHPGGMPNGADRSNISPGGTLFGTGAAGPALRIADDFTLTSPSTINSLTVYAYTTGAGAPTATGMTARILDGVPGSATANVVWGDDTTNVMTSSGWADSPSNLGIFRTADSGPTATNRRIQQLTAGGLNLNLPAGTYWLDFNYTGTNFTPVVSDASTQIVGNAIQSQDSGATYAFPILDNTLQAALPFLIEGTVIPEPSTGIFLLSAVAGVAAFRRRRAC